MKHTHILSARAAHCVRSVPTFAGRALPSVWHNRTHWVLAAAIWTVFGVLQTAAAQDISGRFTLIETNQGVFRIDTVNGNVSRCEQSGGQWACQLLADERRALQNRIARLQDENAQLRRLAGDNGIARDRTAFAPEDDGFQLPSEAEVDRALGLMERVVRRFVGIVRDIDDDMAPDPLRPAP